MIRGQTNVSIAVRRPSGEILVETQPIGWRWARTIRRIPFVRGVIVLSEMLVVGTRALIFSANVATEEEGSDETESKGPGGLSFSGCWRIGGGQLAAGHSDFLCDAGVCDAATGLVSGYIESVEQRH